MPEPSSLPLFGVNVDPGPSFFDLLRHVAPHHLPGFAGDVVMAGDRRATAGFLVAARRIEKVFPADDFSGVAIAGAAGPAVEMVRLFQVQLEHYEKIEGETLSLEGKANQLAQMVRSNLPAAMQGFA